MPPEMVVSTRLFNYFNDVSGEWERLGMGGRETA